MLVLKSLIRWSMVAAPYLAMTILSHWESGESSGLQRIWIIMWIGSGGTLGPLIQARTMHTNLNGDPVKKLQFSYIYVFLLSVPAMGMFIIVGKMLVESEVCWLA